MTLSADEKPPLDYVQNETDDLQDYVPDTLTQSLIGGGIMFVAFLALYGLAEILGSLHTALAGLH